MSQSEKNAIAVIPARGGSKRIPGKNVRDFHGRPIIAYSIEAALESGVFEEVFVSTDSDEIAEVAGANGARELERRPSDLADDHAVLLDVMSHSAQQISQEYPGVEYLCFILATAPFVTAEKITEAFQIMKTGEWDYVLAATDFAAPIQRGFLQTDGGGTEMVFEDMYYERSNDIPTAYYDVGQFYWGKIEKWIEPTKGFYGPKTTFVTVPRIESQDIDTEEDWRTAELLYEFLHRD